MRIGIHPVDSPEGGGIYQVGLTMLEALRQTLRPEDELVVLGRSPTAPLAGRARDLGVEFVQLPPARRAAQRAVDRLRLAAGKSLGVPKDVDRPRRRRRLARALDGQGIELMVYPWPTALSFEAGVPYVMAVHDLQHRLQPEFPEVSADGEWQRREYIFRNGIRHAAIVVAESETGREDILSLYGDTGIAPERVKILPYLPGIAPRAVQESERRRVRVAYQLPERYVFYPAHFWPHKNHVRLVEALQRLDALHLVLVGSFGGALRERTFRAVVDATRRLGVEERVHHLGYVPDEDMPALYSEAAALAMPTFFGPTNVPVLEAWAFGCPVVTSDLRGLREQAEGAAVLVEPRSPEAIAEGIRRVVDDAGLRRQLVDRGRVRLESYTFADYCARVADIVSAAKLWISSSA